MTKSSLGMKGFISSHTSRQPFIKEKVRQEMEAETETEAMKGDCLVSCTLAYSVGFPMYPRTICLGVAQSAIHCILPHSSLIKKMPYVLAYRQPAWRHFSNKVPFSRQL